MSTIQAIRIATTKVSDGTVSYWQHNNEIYRLNEYEPVQFDIYGVPLGARWECSKAHFDAWRNVQPWCSCEHSHGGYRCMNCYLPRRPACSAQ